MKNQEKDRELAGLIRQALGDREEAYIPGAWENFAGKRKKKRRLFFWRLSSGVAASLVGAWLLLQFLSPEVENNLVKTSQMKPDGILPETEAGAESLSLPHEALLGENKNKGAGHTRENKTPALDKNEKLFPSTPEAPVNTFDPNKAGAKKAQQRIKLAKKIFDIGTGDSLQYNKLLGSTTNDVTNTAKKTESPKLSEYDSAILSANLQNVSKNQKRQHPLKEKVRLGIHFSPGFNSTPSNSSFYFSGGFSADFRLTSTIALSTGIQLERQNVLEGSRGNALAEPVKETSADLYCLDLPLNLSWKFYSNKQTSYYIAGGLSSLAYVGEDYQNKTTTQELKETTVIREDGQEVTVYEIITKESTVKQSVSSFQSFDLAGRLNLIIGMEQHLTPRLHLHVEPYLKIPLSGLAAQNLKFTTTGITCKISF